MALIDTPRAHAHPRPAFGLLSRIVEAVISWNDRRATRTALAQLSDRELDDIGLSRGDIDRVARSF
ncbi:DUF1127 domain-containing protein [Roseovarius nitratireducens]|uniref:DUF1127 domain-containing protein n=1 Tax=Roseovarius nitratireducens TaxID=2044597 RepID=UPI000CE1C597|nr:DUF1127 domain-containing protein [Roseovarius nitratireducens]